MGGPGSGGARPGAGRKPAASNVIPFERPKMTIGQALQQMRAPAPALAQNGEATAASSTPPAQTPNGQLPASSAGVVAPPAPTAGALVPAAPAVGPSISLGWCRGAAQLGTVVGVLAMQDHLKKGGFKANEPGDADLEDTKRGLEAGLRDAFGDAKAPWWLQIGLAFGSLYAGMRIGAKRLKKKTTEAAIEESREAAAAAPTPLMRPPVATTAPAAPSSSRRAPPVRPTT